MNAANINNDQADRLAQLAQRRAKTNGGSTPTSAARSAVATVHSTAAGATHADVTRTGVGHWAPPIGAAVSHVAPVMDRFSNVPVIASRRRHAAAASRVLVGGLAGTAFLGSVSTFALADHAAEKARAAAAAQQSATTLPTVVVVTTVHRTVHVDEFGNPIDGDEVLATLPIAEAPAPAPESVPVDSTLIPTGTTISVIPSPAPAVTPVPGAAPSNTAKASTPAGGQTPAAGQPKPVVTQPAPGQPAPVVTQPAPAVTQPEPVVTQPAPVVTEPAPVVTQPAPVVTQPAPVVTQPPPPASTTPPPPPACQGTQCP